MIRIITDSASDYTKAEMLAKDVAVVPLAIQFKDADYQQAQDDDFKMFYELLAECSELPITSQPTPATYLEHFEAAKLAKDDVIVITLSSGLSGTYNSALLAKEMVEYDRIQIIDSQQAILSQKLLVDIAVKLRDAGKDVQSICKELEILRERVIVFGAVDTLKYLSKGGRIPAAAAFIGNVISLKVIIVLEDKILKMFGKTRGEKKAYQFMQEKMTNLGVDQNFPVYFGYTANIETGKEFMNETATKLNITNIAELTSIGGTIGTHVGPNAVAVGFVKKA
jgi:EDD domain protein, DegV family